MEISEAEFERASERAAKRREAGPYAVAVEFDRDRRMIAVSLNNGAEVRFPAGKLEGLAGAADADLAVIEIDPDGSGISFPKLDADFSLPGLLAGIFGSPKWMAGLAAAGRQTVPAE
jgi:hypothetical protein